MTIAVVGQKSPLSKRFIAAGRERGVELFVTGDYGINSVPDLGIFNRYHNGVDYGLIQESRLVAPFDCEVVARFDNHANFGGSLFMYSATHNVTVLYSHMSKISVSVGDRLTDGTLVGLSGGAKGSYGAGTSNGPHLHAGIANGRVTKLDKGNLNDGLWFSIETFDFNKKPQPTKNNEALADEVILGKWGNGTDRKNRLTQAGYDYAAVQSIVDSRYSKKPSVKSNEELATEVINGNWGNGQARKDALAKAGYDYNTIQAIVNKRLG